jgi:hypothetical protein
VKQYKKKAVYSIEALLSAVKAEEPLYTEGETTLNEETDQHEARPATIAEVMAWARERVAELAGVRLEAVKLDLKVEY